MVDPNYSATAFLAENSEFSIDGIFESLQANYERGDDATVVRDDHNVQVNFGSWFLNISEFDQAPDLASDQLILNHRKPMPLELNLAACSRRVKIQSADPYPNMDHINDFLQVCERVCDTYHGTSFVDLSTFGKYDPIVLD